MLIVEAHTEQTVNSVRNTTLSSRILITESLTIMIFINTFYIFIIIFNIRKILQLNTYSFSTSKYGSHILTLNSDKLANPQWKPKFNATGGCCSTYKTFQANLESPGSLWNGNTVYTEKCQCTLKSIPPIKLL